MRPARSISITRKGVIAVEKERLERELKRRLKAEEKCKQLLRLCRRKGFIK